MRASVVYIAQDALKQQFDIFWGCPGRLAPSCTTVNCIFGTINTRKCHSWNTHFRITATTIPIAPRTRSLCTGSICTCSICTRPNSHSSCPRSGPSTTRAIRTHRSEPVGHPPPSTQTATFIIEAYPYPKPSTTNASARLGECRKQETFEFRTSTAIHS